MSVELLFENNQVKVFKNPKKKQGDQTHKAANWPLHSPNWRGSLKVIANGDELYVKLDEIETGVTFGNCTIKKFPGPSVETVVDSSRYFVLKFFNHLGQSAFLGIGFENRNDSTAFTASIQNHFKKISKEKISQGKEAENETSNHDQVPNAKDMSSNGNDKALVPKVMSSNGNENFCPQFINSLADKMMEKYGNDTDDHEIIDLSCMPAIKKRRRSIPTKYATSKTDQPAVVKKGSKTITFTQQEVINVMPSTSNSLQVYQAPCTTITRVEDTSCFVSEKHFSRAAVSNKEYQTKELNKLYKSLLEGDAEIADLLCCVVNSTMRGSPCLTPDTPLPKLPSHSFPVFRFDKNRVPFFILICKSLQSKESPTDLLNDLTDDIIQKSSLIYQILLKHQAGEIGQGEKEHHFEKANQQTLLLQHLKKLLHDKKAVQAARQSLKALYENELPNPKIFDVIVQLDAQNKPLFKFFLFPKDAPFDLSDSLPNYDPLIHSYSKTIYELIYLGNRSTKTVADKS